MTLIINVQYHDPFLVQRLRVLEIIHVNKERAQVAVFGKVQQQMLLRDLDRDIDYLNDQVKLELHAKEETWPKYKFPMYRKMCKNFATVLLQVTLLLTHQMINNKCL